MLDQIFAQIDVALADVSGGSESVGDCSTRLLTLLADGTDHQAAQLGLDRGWDLTIPLPFGRQLNAAINAAPVDPIDARAILAGEAITDEGVAARVAAIMDLADRGTIFELADEDERLADLFLKAIEGPRDPNTVGLFAAESGRRAALAGRILIEQSDLIIAVWDGQSFANAGGTGHTAMAALKLGSPVLWIDPQQPEDWQVISSPEALNGKADVSERASGEADLKHLIEQAVTLAAPSSDGPYAGLAALSAQNWRDQSSVRSHAFRRIEAMFGQRSLGKKFASVRQSYEHPDQIAQGNAKPMLAAIEAIGAGTGSLRAKIADQILTRFAWLDGISAHLSDRHRSGMVINFLLGASAIVAGTLYLPLVDVDQKWIFAGIELGLLLAIIINTAAGRKLRLHGRWFETRRAAEYLRHSPVLAVMGVARPSGHWPQGTNSWWPEWYARHAIRAVGLPNAKVDMKYLRSAIEALRDHHVDPQRAYHREKSQHLALVHHGLDRLSERLFVGAVFLVSAYLALVAGAHWGLVDPSWSIKSAKWFTVLAVALPTLGGALAGIRYFGDFERFAEISEITAEKLDGIAVRIDTMLNASEHSMTYGHIADIARATDEVVFAEIQNWQAVFSGKTIAVPA
ncbi:hypothetical protein [Pontixanthobacter sp. CEM42]|uniref:hypothetical protein n=1 Tax=Pontixanthobacter sp. CEM42 TaxID=2792077 RepID=UPI001ADF2D57|nr:hypothetical protein [Pontixanthobacter sp. CEM42]